MEWNEEVSQNAAAEARSILSSHWKQKRFFPRDSKHVTKAYTGFLDRETDVFK
jgi:hypothetical protein